MFPRHLLVIVISFTLITLGWTQELHKSSDETHKPCKCYMLGTVETKSGLSLCDEQATCKCLPHLIGTDCNKCENGYYGILGGKGCKPCDCDSEGAESTHCHQSTGQCLCKDGFTGLHCDMCDLPFGYVGNFQFKCTTPCDKYRSVDPLFLYENGTCQCKPNANGGKCSNCKDNFYFDNNTFECTKCPTCYNVLNEKITNLEETLQNFTQLISDHLKNSKHEYAFLVKLKTVKNNICGMLNKLLKQPHIKEIVKLTHLEAILDLMEKSIKDIAFYLNGYINYKHLQNKLKHLETMISDFEKLLDKSNTNPNGFLKDLQQIVEDANAEADRLKKVADKFDNENQNLRDDASHNSTATHLTLNQIKKKQIDDLKKFKMANDLLTQVKESCKNKNKAKSYLDEANKLKLPKLIEQELEPMLNGTFDDLSERIEDAKRKHDAIQDILKVLNDTEMNKVINGKTNKKLQKQKDVLFSRVNETHTILSEKLEELKKKRKDINEDIDNTEQKIAKLNSDIDKKKKMLDDIMTKIEEAKEQADKQREELQKFQKFEEVLTELLQKLKEFKEERKKMHQDIVDLNVLLAKIKKLFTYRDTADEKMKELKDYIKKFKDLIKTMEELTEFFKLIPVDEFDNIEKLFNNFSQYLTYIKTTKHQIKTLKKDIKGLEEFLISLPDEKFLMCNVELT